jgi:hypothetical protein
VSYFAVTVQGRVKGPQGSTALCVSVCASCHRRLLRFCVLISLSSYDPLRWKQHVSPQNKRVTDFVICRIYCVQCATTKFAQLKRVFSSPSAAAGNEARRPMCWNEPCEILYGDKILRHAYIQMSLEHFRRDFRLSRRRVWRWHSLLGRCAVQSLPILLSLPCISWILNFRVLTPHIVLPVVLYPLPACCSSLLPLVPLLSLSVLTTFPISPAKVLLPFPTSSRLYPRFHA